MLLLFFMQACAPMGYDPYAIPGTASPTSGVLKTNPTTNTPTPQPRTCEVIAAQALNLRAEAGVNNSVIAWLVPGDVLTITNTQPKGAWIEIIYKDRTGWINSEYCQ